MNGTWLHQQHASKLLATVFCQWQIVHGVKTGAYYAERRLKFFLQYLAHGGYHH